MLKNKVKQEESPPKQLVQGRYDFLEDLCSEIVLQVNQEGDFVISFDAKDSNLDYVGAIGNLIFLINSGTLASFFIKSLHLWAEEVEGEERDKREAFVTLIINQWEDTQEEHQEMLDKINQSTNTTGNQSAVDPSRVFNLRKYL